MKASRPTRERMAPFHGRLAGDPLRGDIIRHPPCGRQRMPPVHLAVREEHFGLTLFLVFFDRCGNCEFPSSATGGGNPQFPVRGGGITGD